MTQAVLSVIPTDIPLAPGTCDGIDGMALFGAQVTVTLASGQKLNASGSVSLGAAGNPVKGLHLNLCAQPSSGALVVPTGSFSGLTLPGNSLQPYSISRMPSTTDLLPGSYAVGLCGCVDGNVAPETDISWLTVQVVQS